MKLKCSYCGKHGKLTEVITKLDLEGRIELVVVDIDGSEALSAASEFLDGVRGAGETAGSPTAWSSPRKAWAWTPRFRTEYEGVLLESP